MSNVIPFNPRKRTTSSKPIKEPVDEFSHFSTIVTNLFTNSEKNSFEEFISLVTVQIVSSPLVDIDKVAIVNLFNHAYNELKFLHIEYNKARLKGVVGIKLAKVVDQGVETFMMRVVVERAKQRWLNLNFFYVPYSKINFKGSSHKQYHLSLEGDDDKTKYFNVELVADERIDDEVNLEPIQVILDEFIYNLAHTEEMVTLEPDEVSGTNIGISSIRECSSGMYYKDITVEYEGLSLIAYYE